MFDRSDLSFELSLAHDWRAHVRPSRDFSCSPTFSRAGLEALVDDAIREWPERSLPWNLSTHGPAVNLSHTWNIPCRKYPDMVEKYARFAGWLRAVRKDPLAVRVVCSAVSYRGMFSPATWVDLWELSRKLSPGALSRQIRQVKARADEILAPFGARAANWAIAIAVTRGPRQTGKAAIWAAAMTLDRGKVPRSYRAAREMLVQMARRGSHEADGIVVAGITQQKLGFCFIDGFVHNANRPWRREPMCVIWKGSRSYHAKGRLAQQVDYCPFKRGFPALLAMAKAAWNARDRAQALEDAMVSDRVVVLCLREDSYGVGNCKPGTEAFLRSHGWEDRWCVPVPWLIETGNLSAHAAAKEATRAFLAGRS